MPGPDPVVKHSPADFTVRENLVVDLAHRNVASHEYLLLRKAGYTTFEAIRLVADALEVPPGEVTYAGLKDEDGVTEQLVAVPVRDRDGAPRTVAGGPDRWLSLHHYGFGRTPMTVGHLNGNGFRTVVRNLDDAHAARLAGLGRLTTFFLNYYDTQRFGVPGGRKLTHTVGAAVLDEDWDTALRRLTELGSPESPRAGAWTGGGREFFGTLDPRVVAFYCAAHTSFAWNAELCAVIERTCPEETYSLRVDGLRYRYVSSPEAAVRVLAVARDLPHIRYTVVDGRPRPTPGPRTTVVQTVLTAEKAEPDECFPGRHRVTLSFFLPSGCYATAAIRQLLGYLRENVATGSSENLS